MLQPRFLQTEWTSWRLFREMAGREPLHVRVSGECMAPLLVNGSRLAISEAAMYWPGDIIMVIPAAGGIPFVHRLIGYIWRDGALHYVTRADSHQRPDAPVTRQRILGRVTGGQCSHQLIRIPLGHRFLAAGRFISYILRGSLRRIWRLLKLS